MQLPKNLYTAIQTLNLLDRFQQVAQSQSFEEVTRQVEAFKQDAKQTFKALSRKHHPDVGGDEETMKAIAAAYNEIKKMQVARPQPVVQFVRINFSPFGGSWTGNTSTTTSTGWY